jgi:D-glycero-alpha-D-manno-heptose-7-phosphate kinase
MIISRTPHRISFFGGGTDYPSYYLENGGKVIGSAIDKYCYLNVRKLPPFFNHKHRIVYSKSENVNTLDEIQHPSVRATLKYLNVDYGISIHHDGDIPARSGMGSSSAFTAGLLNSLLALKGQYISKEDLSRETLKIEQEIIAENVGSQDQIFAAYGGFNIIEFLQNGEFMVTPMIIPAARLERFQNSLVLIYTGLSRIASEIAAEQISNTVQNTSALGQMKSLVDEAADIISNPNRQLNEFGKLLNETWQLKKSLSSRIATPEIDDLYTQALKAGATGGKLLGAGGGGFMLFFTEPERREELIASLANYLHVPFRFDFEGSKIIVYRPNS